eukprot:GHVQ01008752.1.p1 GENE.GHVQ01008752.1~~GHVQ01008752.1.p1  ORF type:complete len:1208 (+),score=134.28 GHVQ01008752.1:90-3713(+)
MKHIHMTTRRMWVILLIFFVDVQFCFASFQILEDAGWVSPSWYRHATRWSTYNPSVYFEISGKEAHSFRSGIAWERSGRQSEYRKYRHRVLDGEEGVDTVLWMEHDGISYGHQHIIDSILNDIAINTTFSKPFENLVDVDHRNSEAKALDQWRRPWEGNERKRGQAFTYRVDAVPTGQHTSSALHDIASVFIYFIGGRKSDSFHFHPSSQILQTQTNSTSRGRLKLFMMGGVNAHEEDGSRGGYIGIRGSGSLNDTIALLDVSCPDDDGHDNSFCKSVEIFYVGTRLRDPESSSWKVEQLVKRLSRDAPLSEVYPTVDWKSVDGNQSVSQGRIAVLPNTMAADANCLVIQMLVNMGRSDRTQAVPTDRRLRVDVHVSTEGIDPRHCPCLLTSSEMRDESKVECESSSSKTTNRYKTAILEHFDRLWTSSPSVIETHNPLRWHFDSSVRHWSSHFKSKIQRTYFSMNRRTVDDHLTQAKEVAIIAFSNLMGSRGFFHGTLKAVLPVGVSPPPTLHTSLLAYVPSRSVFPRPFLWDDGFHMEIAVRWDPRAAMEQLLLWMKSMYVFPMSAVLDSKEPGYLLDSGVDSEIGWIPREPALGAAAEARIPKQFLIQHWQVANPPSLILPITQLMESAELLSLGEQLSGSHQHQALKAASRNFAQRTFFDSTSEDHAEATDTCPSLTDLTYAAQSSCVATGNVVEAEKIQFRKSVVLFLHEMFPWLVRWYNYFVTTQRSATSYDHASNSSFRTHNSSSASSYYRWHKRSAAHNLASGFDDFPRGLLVSDAEAHLDLHVWILALAQTIHIVCSVLQGADIAAELQIDPRLPAMFSGSSGTRAYDCNHWTLEVLRLSSSMMGSATIASTSLTSRHILSSADDVGHLSSGSVLYNPQLKILNDYLGDQPSLANPPRTSESTLMVLPPWRDDGRCGASFPGRDGRSGRCNPYGGSPCCSASGWCGSGADYCLCRECVKSLPLEASPRSWGIGSKLQPAHSPHVGAVSLLPLAFGMLPAASKPLNIPRSLPGTMFSQQSVGHSEEATFEVCVDLRAMRWHDYLSFLPYFGGNISINHVPNAESLVDDYLSQHRGNFTRGTSRNGSLGSVAGVRSLSSLDQLYRTGEDYWRGHVWMNVNFLLLRGIKKFYWNNASDNARNKMQELYELVRDRVAATVTNGYLKQGSFYERYDDVTQLGVGADPFTGWTATVLLIIAEIY